MITSLSVEQNMIESVRTLYTDCVRTYLIVHGSEHFSNRQMTEIGAVNGKRRGQDNEI